MKLHELFKEAIKDAERLVSLATEDDSLPSDSVSVLLRAALVMAMAAVDKVLHEALSKRFTTLARGGHLNKLVQIELSKAYQISLAARESTGKDGKAKRRPGHDIKAEVLERIYRDSYLSVRELYNVCAACDKKSIFKRYAGARKKSGKSNRSAQYLESRWSRIYQRRNRIAHECDIKRQPKMRTAHFYPVDKGEIKRDINFVKNFGRFLASELE